MNLPRHKSFVGNISGIRTILIPILLVIISVYSSGCSDDVRLPTPLQLREFENAGPIPPTVDTDRMVKAKIGGGPYRVVSGDALELTMPAIVRFITSKEINNNITITPYISRVNPDGNITLPIIGDINAANRTLAQIEADIIDAYFPKHVVTRPSVYARVLEYKTYKISVTGAVLTPGIYSLRSDQMSLVALLMEAGGISEGGAALIRIIHSNQAVSNFDDAAIKTAMRSSKDPDSLAIVNPVKHAELNIVTNEREIPPYFRNAYSTSTIGALSTGQNNTMLITENNHLGPLLKDRLATNEPFVPAYHIGENIFRPAEPLIYDPTNNSNTVAMVNSNLESDMRNLQLNADSGRITAPNSNFRLQRITEKSKKRKSESFILPVKGHNIPFTDVVLQDGDAVIVERLQQPLFTVMELVNQPGNFPYPPDVKYTLMQAIGFAGGLNLIAEPRYATIYRLKRDGKCISVTFPIKGKSKLADASNTLIKPGDIIAVEHTPRTRTTMFLDRSFRISIGTYWRLNDTE